MVSRCSARLSFVAVAMGMLFNSKNKFPSQPKTYATIEECAANTPGFGKGSSAMAKELEPQFKAFVRLMLRRGHCSVMAVALCECANCVDSTVRLFIAQSC